MPLLKEEIYTIEDIYALPEGERAELIDGNLYMMAPPAWRHQRLVGRAYQEIANYIRDHGGDCNVVVSPFGVYLSDETEYVEPDVTVVCDPSRLDEKGCHGAPDWVIEVVSPASRNMDYMIKLFKYRTAGVREYWIVDPEWNQVFVYRFEIDQFEDYTLQDPIPSGIYDGLEIVLEG